MSAPKLPRMLLAAVPLLLSFHASAAVYRCTVPGKPDSYQGTPCDDGRGKTAISAPSSSPSGSDVQVQPYAGLSREQRVAYDELMMHYAETFMVLGRAKTCGMEEKRLKQMSEKLITEIVRRHDLNERHGESDRAPLTIALGAATAGARGLTKGIEGSNTTPPGRIPCAEALSRAQNLRLPAVPASLALRPGEAPIDGSLAEFSSSTGEVRVVRTVPTDPSKKIRYAVLHRGREVFGTTDVIDYHLLIEGKMPALLIGTKQVIAGCRTPRSYTVISLPAGGVGLVTPMNLKCMQAPPDYMVFHEQHLCFYDGLNSGRRSTQIFRIDETGKPAWVGETVGCPD